MNLRLLQLMHLQKKCIAAGIEAREMIGRTPKSMICIRPLKDGVVADYEATDMMLNYFLKKCNFKRMVQTQCDFNLSSNKNYIGREKCNS